MPMPRFARIVQQHDVLRLKKDQQFFIDPESMADGVQPIVLVMFAT